jgi:thioredoxin 2
MATLNLDDRGLLVTCANCGQTNRLLYQRLGDSVRCGKCKENLTIPDVPLEVASSADFDQLVTHTSIPVVVDFWAEWCGPCRMVAPELAKVAARAAGRFLIVKVDTDALADLSERYAIRSIPTLAVFANGREVTRTSGARPANDIEQFIVQAAQTVRAG